MDLAEKKSLIKQATLDDVEKYDLKLQRIRRQAALADRKSEKNGSDIESWVHNHPLCVGLIGSLIGLWFVYLAKDFVYAIFEKHPK